MLAAALTQLVGPAALCLQLLLQADAILSAAAAAAETAASSATSATASGQSPDALQLLQQLRADASSVAGALGVLYNVSGDFGSGAAAFRRALGASPAASASRHTLLNRLGASLSQQRDQAGALEAYAAALCAKPHFARCWFNRGIALYNSGHALGAAQSYLHALRLSPGAAHIWPLVRGCVGGWGGSARGAW